MILRAACGEIDLLIAGIVAEKFVKEKDSILPASCFHSQHSACRDIITGASKFNYLDFVDQKAVENAIKTGFFLTFLFSIPKICSWA
jgi:hypothetical protein